MFRLAHRILALLWVLCSSSIMLNSAESEYLEQEDLFVSGQDGVVQFRIPSLVVTNAGTLLAFCDARVEKGGDAPNNIDIVMKRSTNGGKLWGPMRTLLDNGAGAAGDPLALVDRETGTIWVFVVQFPPEVGAIASHAGFSGPTATYWAVKSDDDGISWSKPIDLTSQFKRPGWRAGSLGPGNGIQMRSGRLIVPRYFFAGEPDEPMRASCFVSYSDDHGETWKLGGTVKPEELTNECQVVELADGSLLMNMRNVINGRGNFRKTARSFDGGETWTEMVDDMQLIEPVRGCQASMFTLTSQPEQARNRLLFANPASLRRNNMTIQLSYDEGKTWPVSRQLHGGPAAYSALAVMPDGSIACLYERADNQLYEKITFARFNLEWLTRGRDSLSE